VQEGDTTRKIGVVTLPSFYSDSRGRQKGDSDYRSASRDTARILTDFRKQKVDGVIVDLRNNGGGSLTEAIELTGLFIETGPIVQQRNARGQIQVERDTDASVAWEGPLAVMINRNSASASEIFAAAIQDYGRGLIMGERTFGKGTVQTLINLDQFKKDEAAKFGELKVTTAQFFRINGSTTQLSGVTPDLTFPSANDGEPFGEASYDNPLPATQIRAADYAQLGNLRDLVPMLQPLHQARIKSDREFQDLQEDIIEARLNRKKTTISLNETTRRAERAADEAKVKARLARKDPKGIEAAKDELATDDGLQADERKLSRLLAAEKARKDAKDPLLVEAARVLSDGIGIAATDSRFAVQLRPSAPMTYVPN
jgi:carboxyl-terminal processing protease